MKRFASNDQNIPQIQYWVFPFIFKKILIKYPIFENFKLHRNHLNYLVYILPKVNLFQKMLAFMKSYLMDKIKQTYSRHVYYAADQTCLRLGESSLFRRNALLKSYIFLGSGLSIYLFIKELKILELQGEIYRK